MLGSERSIARTCEQRPCDIFSHGRCEFKAGVSDNASFGPRRHPFCLRKINALEHSISARETTTDGCSMADG